MLFASRIQNLQVQIIRSKTVPDYKPPYTTVSACVKATLRENGFRGPFQVRPYAHVRALARGRPAGPRRGAGRGADAAAAAAAASGRGASAAREAPIGRLRRGARPQTSAGRAFATPKRAPNHRLQGLGATILRNTPANAVYLGTFEVLKRAASQQLGVAPAELPAWAVLSSAGLGGICYWVVIFPVDCIKSAMQTDTITRAQRKYTTIPVTAKVRGSRVCLRVSACACMVSALACACGARGCAFPRPSATPT